MNTLSIRKRIVLLAVLPLLLLTLLLGWLGSQLAQEIAGLGVGQLRQSLYDERKAQLDAYLELALTAMATTADPAEKKQILRTLRYENGKNYFFVYDTAGNQIVSADNPAREGKNFLQAKSPEGRFLVQEYIAAASKGGGYVEYRWPRPGSDVPAPKLAKAVAVPDSDWVLATGFYIDDLEQRIQTLNQTTNNMVNSAMLTDLVIVMVLLLLLGSAGLYLAQGITRPLATVVSAMQNVARGEGDLTQRLPTDAGHELAELAQAFNAFAGKVALLVNNLRISVASLRQLSQSLEQLMQQTGAATAQQHLESDAVATAMHQMSATALEVARSASGAAQATRQTEQQVDGSATVLQHTVSVIGQLEQQVETGVQVISELGRESTNIGSVLDVIRGVAEQTNLLALNAAIEAARAGEQGRGFAVVADEVRTLAARTASSTDEINQMIGRLQQGARQAVTAIESIRQHSRDAVSQTDKVSQALTEIHSAVTVINDMNTQIASAAEQQTTVSDTINQNIHQIATLSLQTAETAERTLQITTELNQLASAIDQQIHRYQT
ncbi:MAG: methyl-accepting chemotaxis protein [Rheinheimera sp.]|nr:MAG: methyl-accepting chemotaxis protein [Rheinheimera sp.]